MKQVFLKQEGNSRLLLFFAGWGADEHLFGSSVAEGYDCMICYDYTSPGFIASWLEAYDSIRLLGWSMGVWAAGEALSSYTLPYEKKIAINGTPFPISDTKGIPIVVFEGTLDGLSADTLAKFRRRMCGSAGALQGFMQHQPQRSLENLRGELAALKQRIEARGDMGYPLEWDEALIGDKDRIFSPANQERAWEEASVPVRHFEGAHYDATCIAQLIGGNEAWIKH